MVRGSVVESVKPAMSCWMVAWTSPLMLGPAIGAGEDGGTAAGL